MLHGFSSASLFQIFPSFSFLVVFYLGIIFSICQILLASWIDHLGSTVEVHVCKICFSLHRFMFYLLKWSQLVGGETIQPIEGTSGGLSYQVQWPWFCLRTLLPHKLLLSPGFRPHNIWRLLIVHQWPGQHDTLSLPLLDGTSAGSRDNSLLSNYFVCYWPFYNVIKQVEQYGSETLMGIVSISLLILALSGPCHLFNSVSWVENLQSRST